MADHSNVAASVAAVVALGFEIAKGLYKLADGVGSGGKEVRSLANDVNSFSRLFGRLRTQLLEPTAQRHGQDDLIRDVLDVCDRVLEPLQHMQEQLNPLLARFAETPSKLVYFAMRVHWLFTKDKMLWLRGVLGVQQQLLDTILELIILGAARNRSLYDIGYPSFDESHFLAECDSMSHVSLEMSVQGIKGTLQDKRQVVEYSPDMGHRLLAPTALSLSGLPNPLSSSLEPTRSTQFDQLPDEETEVTELASLAEQQFDEEVQQSAQEIWEETRVVSRKIVKRAESAIHVNKAFFSSSTDGLGSALTSSAPSLRSADILTIDTPISTVQGDNASDEAQTPQQLSASTGRPVQYFTTFHNHNGRRYEVPEKFITTWSDMQSLLNSLFETADPKHFNAYHNDEWDILNKEGVILLPQFWPDVMMEETDIFLRFRDQSLNTTDPTVLHGASGGRGFKRMINGMVSSRTRRKDD